jgi:aldehyde:ferredoxin oxidoreductase
MFGYGGKVLRVNLTEKKIGKKNLDPNLAKEWLGSRASLPSFFMRNFQAGSIPSVLRIS